MIFTEPVARTNPKKIFHGGCHGCEMQISHGLSKCGECQYHSADWSKPNLNTLDKKKERWMRTVKFFARLRISISGEKVVFHGGCLGCKSQEKHGIRKCLGCQYMEADWNKSDLSIK